MDIPSTFVWTHDSIGLGEDGPTHQPVEHLASLRAIPNLAVIRPADANEVAIAWREIIKRNKPAGIILSRQNLPIFDRAQYASQEGVAKGAYVLHAASANPDVLLIATGSEVAIAVAASELLAQKGVNANVISAPCLEWFAEQDSAYRNSVLPRNVKARVSIEAGIAQNWYQYLGDAGVAVSLEHFGASASAGELFADFGFSAENVANAALASIKKVNGQ
jgi:transketolase